MSSYSIAICISGQIRGSATNLYELADEVKASGADVFVSVWSAVGQKTFEGAVGPKNIRRIVNNEIARILPEEWLGRMKEVFPNFQNFFPKNSQIDKVEIEAIFENSVVEVEQDGPQFDFSENDSNSLRMLYKIWRANQLKRAAERKRNKRYDLVLRVRPDMLFDGSSLKNLKLNKTDLLVQGHAHNRPNYMNDTIWATSSENDDAICALYHKTRNVDEFGWEGIHKELWKIAASLGLSPKTIKIIRRGPESRDQRSLEVKKVVGENLIEAIARNEMNFETSGGIKYCELVSSIVQRIESESAFRNIIVSDTIKRLEILEDVNLNSYLHAIIYTSNIYICDNSAKLSDRFSLMWRILSYYCHKNAEVYLDTKINELPEIFESHLIELQSSLCSEIATLQPCSDEISSALAARFDKFWAEKIHVRQNEVLAETKIKIFSASQLMIDLHRKLSALEKHREAFALAQKWVNHCPANWQAYDRLAGSAQALGWPDLAERIYEDAEQKTEPHPRLFELKGKLLSRMGRFSESKLALERSLQLPGCNKTRVGQLLDNLRLQMDKG